jgi:hypothetical protein
MKKKYTIYLAPAWNVGSNPRPRTKVESKPWYYDQSILQLPWVRFSQENSTKSGIANITSIFETIS